ncbi:MAG TPA: ABC transporter permease [Solirubrobacterales bacterium]|nr:ABC transporter permease [Solirubrobacterales bacterium]
MTRWLLPAAVLTTLVAAWQVAASTGAIADALAIEPFLFPSPAEIASSMWEDRSLLAENALVTLKVVLLGFLCAATVGLAFAAALHLSNTLRHAFYPLLIASQTIPIVVVAPILMIWFGFGIGPKLAIVALICFFPITVNTIDGLRSVDPESIKTMRTLDASRRQIFHRVEMPTALPFFFSGARIAIAVAVIATVFAEWASSDASAAAGLGDLIFEDLARLETARIFAATVILSAIAIVLFGLIALAERRVVRWR